LKGTKLRSANPCTTQIIFTGDKGRKRHSNLLSGETGMVRQVASKTTTDTNRLSSRLSHNAVTSLACQSLIPRSGQEVVIWSLSSRCPAVHPGRLLVFITDKTGNSLTLLAIERACREITTILNRWRLLFIPPNLTLSQIHWWVDLCRRSSSLDIQRRTGVACTTGRVLNGDRFPRWQKLER